MKEEQVTNNWNNFPKIKEGDKVKITWSEKYYGIQDIGTAYLDNDMIMVKFEGNNISADALRENQHIDRTEII